MSRRKGTTNRGKAGPPPLSARQLWAFRLAALFAVPMLLLALLELILRVAGFGYPAAFLLESSNRGEKTFVQNNQFGWRFFGPRMARLPDPISIPREKPPDTIRIVVFGESAAYGDPQPRFGLPRLLQALLSLRHSEKKFEVINAAMTGINSHVILPLARDCAKARGDVWVVYMGNNEVVGPFGAGTVFGNQTLPLPLIRAGLALKATRAGQLFDTLRASAQKPPSGNGEWAGMRMFVNYKLAASDPRLQAVYGNFAENLKSIINSGESAGAKIVLSTVAVNLKDCAPFASLHRPELSESQLQNWQRWFDAGVKAQAAGELAAAASDYDKAAQIDDDYAELRFRAGQCALESNNRNLARTEFAAARDLDALRFRCDSRLNNIIREEAKEGAVLADGEQAVASLSSTGIAGSESFYEHVHLTFPGNYALARAIAEKVETVLTLPGNSRWPDIAECAQRLGRTERDTQLALSDMLGRLTDVPFTFQASHHEQMRLLTEAARRLPPPNSAAPLRQAQSAAESALSRWPDDAPLWEQLGEIKQTEGDYAGALAAAQRSLDIIPTSAECWLLYGLLLAQQQKYGDAVPAFERVFALDPQAVWGRHNLALCFEKLGRRDEAVREFKRALAIKPEFGTSWLALGQLYDDMGRANDAERCFNAALTNRVNRADDLAILARFCLSRHRFDLAASNFIDAIALSPSDPGLYMEAGRALDALGRHDQAARQYAMAVQLDPGEAQPHIQLGVEWGRLEKPILAEKEFRNALQITPDSTEARVDLGIALYKQQKANDALQEFQTVLQHAPDDPTALRYVRLLSR